jgi:Ca2+-binding EF-hand superfamily protein
VEADTEFHKALRWPSVLAAMRKQRILTGENDAEKMMLWFGATDGGEVTFAMLMEKLKNATPMDDPHYMISLLLDEADRDKDGKLNIQDLTRLLKSPPKRTMARYCAMKLF